MSDTLLQGLLGCDEPMLIECDLAQPLQLGQNRHVKTLAKYEGFDIN